MPCNQEQIVRTDIYSLDIFVVSHLFLHSKRDEVIYVFIKERRTNMIIVLRYSFYLLACIPSKRASSKGRENQIPRFLPGIDVGVTVGSGAAVGVDVGVGALVGESCGVVVDAGGAVGPVCGYAGFAGGAVGAAVGTNGTGIVFCPTGVEAAA